MAMQAAIIETPQFRSQLRKPSPNIFKSPPENEDMTSLSSDKKNLGSVKRKLEYNSPLKDKMILHLLQRGPSLDV